MEIFSDSEFERYRVAELEEGLSVLKMALDNPNPEYLKGAMDMLKRVINLPPKLVPKENESRRIQAQALKAKAIAVFESKLLRMFVESDE